MFLLNVTTARKLSRSRRPSRNAGPAAIRCPPILFRAIRDEWVFTTTEICFIQELLGAFEGLYGVFLRK